MNPYIPFNKPFIAGAEMQYMADAVATGRLSGNGKYTAACSRFFEKEYGFKKTLLTTSGTAALEMCALLCNIQPGDEVIVPSFTFVSTANPFVMRGATIRFCDSSSTHPNIDVSKIESLITDATKAIVVTHYAGIACHMNTLLHLANKYKLLLIEDAAHAIDSFYNDRPLGSIGHLAAFSFHETKNIISGEGGMLVINDTSFAKRAEIIWEKGTNRAQFFRGEIEKYQWVDVGSSFLPSELTAAFLYGQLEHLKDIQLQRKRIWNNYYEQLGNLQTKGSIQLPSLPDYATNNAHIFYILCQSFEERSRLIQYLSERSILAVFHYQPLHLSPFYQNRWSTGPLPNAEYFAHHLLRLPLYYTLSVPEQQRVITAIQQFYDA
jgi:dTDP-4-amino-4,6-dideoxygalactose transaminase